MVEESTMLIISDKEQSLIPLWGASQSLINLLHKPLALCHIVGWMVIICRAAHNIKIALFNHRVVWQLPKFGMRLEEEIVGDEVWRIFGLPEVTEEESGGNLLIVDPEC